MFKEHLPSSLVCGPLCTKALRKMEGSAHAQHEAYNQGKGA